MLFGNALYVMMAANRDPAILANLDPDLATTIAILVDNLDKHLSFVP